MLTVGDYVTFGYGPVTLQIGSGIENTYTVTLPSKQMEAGNINDLQ